MRIIKKPEPEQSVQGGIRSVLPPEFAGNPAHSADTCVSSPDNGGTAGGYYLRWRAFDPRLGSCFPDTLMKTRTARLLSALRGKGYSSPSQHLYICINKNVSSILSQSQVQFNTLNCKKCDKKCGMYYRIRLPSGREKELEPLYDVK